MLGNLIETSADSWGEEGTAVNECLSSKSGEQPPGRQKRQWEVRVTD